MSKTILFVCTGNIFRSYFAEAILRHLAKDAVERQILSVISAGIAVKSEKIHPMVAATLREQSITLPSNYATPLNDRMLNEADVIVGMAKNHVDYMNSTYKQEAILFNQLCYDLTTDVPDIHEAIPHWQQLSVEEIGLFVQQVFIHIHTGIANAMPQILGVYHA